MTNPATDPTIDDLVARFPRLFHNKQPRVWSSLPRGWSEIADKLFGDLDSIVDDDAATRFEILQIKEKFGGLRVYWKLGKEATTVVDVIDATSVQRLDAAPAAQTDLFGRIQARVQQAAEDAAKTCQRCGNGGASAGGSGWISTLCDACRRSTKQQDAL